MNVHVNVPSYNSTVTWVSVRCGQKCQYIDPSTLWNALTASDYWDSSRWEVWPVSRKVAKGCPPTVQCQAYPWVADGRRCIPCVCASPGMAQCWGHGPAPFCWAQDEGLRELQGSLLGFACLGVCRDTCLPCSSWEAVLEPTYSFCMYQCTWKAKREMVLSDSFNPFFSLFSLCIFWGFFEDTFCVSVHIACINMPMRSAWSLRKILHSYKGNWPSSTQRGLQRRWGVSLYQGM